MQLSYESGVALDVMDLCLDMVVGWMMTNIRVCLDPVLHMDVLHGT